MGAITVVLLLGAMSATTLAAMPLTNSEPAGRAVTQLTRLGDMSVPRAAHQATSLQHGEILITGGCTGTCDTGLSSTELYDPQSRTLRSATAMNMARDSHAALLLKDGRVLITGGWSERQATASAEIFDPAAQRFVTTGAMTVGRAAPVAALLADGRALIIGGQSSSMEPLASAELFEPESSRFLPTSPMAVPRIGHVAVVLLDGRVLVSGGRQARRGDILNSAEIFDPVTGQFQATGSMKLPRHKHAAVRLPDGRVLIIGGADIRDQRGRYRSTEIYDPNSGTFSAGPQMQWPRFKIPDAVATMPSGAILVAGGARQMEWYDPTNNRFVVMPGELDMALEFATASTLPNGEVLVVGGYDDNIRTSAAVWLVPTDIASQAVSGAGLNKAETAAQLSEPPFPAK